VQHLVDDTLHRLLDLRARRRRQRGQAAFEPAHLGPHHPLGHLAQRHDGRRDAGGALPGQERRHLVGDDGARRVDVGGVLVALECVGERLEVDDGDTGQVTRPRLHVPREREVDEGDRSATSRPLGLCEQVHVDDVADGARAGDHQVGLGERAAEVVERGRPPTDRRRDALGVGQRAVGHDDSARATLAEQAGRECAHRAGADHQRGPALDRPDRRCDRVQPGGHQ
jgi:hypothetical protein